MEKFAYSSVDGMMSDYPVQALQAIKNAHEATLFEKLLGSFVVLFT